MLAARLPVTLPRCCDNQARNTKFPNGPGGTPVNSPVNGPGFAGGTVIRMAGAYAPLSEYLPTRILEAIVHGDDVGSIVPDLQVPDPRPPGWETPGHSVPSRRPSGRPPKPSGHSEPSYASTLRRKFLRPNARKITLNAMMAG
jgi:hypothetical protein